MSAWIPSIVGQMPEPSPAPHPSRRAMDLTHYLQTQRHSNFSPVHQTLRIDGQIQPALSVFLTGGLRNFHRVVLRPIPTIERHEPRMTGSSPSGEIHSAGKRSFSIWASDIAAAPDARPNTPAMGDVRGHPRRARIAAPSGAGVRIRLAHRLAGAGNVKPHKRNA